MDLRKQRNTDAEETTFVSASEIAAKRSTDQFDTQQLDRDAVRAQVATYHDRNPYRRSKPQLHGTPMPPEQENAASYSGDASEYHYGYGNAPQPPYNNAYGNTPQPPYNNSYGNASQPPYNNGYGNASQPPYNNGYGNAPQPPYNKGYGNAPQPPYNNGYGNAPQLSYNNGYVNAPQPPYNNGYGNAPQPPYSNSYGSAPQSAYSNGYGNAPQPNAYGRSATAAPPRPQSTPPRSQPASSKPQPASQPAASKKTVKSSAPSSRSVHTSAPAEPEKRRSTPISKKRADGGTVGKVVRFILWAIIIVFVLYSLLALVGILRMQKETAENRSNISDAMEASYVSNVLLIGTDSRDLSTDRGRSDSMILLSINRKTNEIVMTSFLRDAYVYINDTYGSGKLNAAYSYGGAALLMDTIEANYHVRIDDYVLISFAACANVIDAVGGVELELSDSEADAVNEILISEVNELMGDGREDDLLDSGGTQKLNGKQALSYSRIRYVGNADFERTSRQRTVMTQVLQKAAKNPAALASIFLTALPELSTNLSVGKAYSYALRAPFLLIGYHVVQQQIPADGTFYGDTIDGESVLVITDSETNQKNLEETIFRKS